MSDAPTIERAIVVPQSLACEYGLEEATMIAVLTEFSHYQAQRLRNGYAWFRVTKVQCGSLMPFWTDLDIQRVSQSLRAKGVLLLASAPFVDSQEIKFAFNRKAAQDPTEPTTRTAQPAPTNLPIASNWVPSDEIMARLAEMNIPAQFAREQLSEFVSYWRERGESHRTWGSKFQTYVLRRWRQFEQRQAQEQKRQARHSRLPEHWQPDDQVIAQLSQEGIPLAHINDCANRFRLYYRDTGNTSASWAMAFYSWVKKDWDEKQTPFLNNRKPAAMHGDWSPGIHTLEYLQGLGIDSQFIRECIPEFVHKWIEQGSYRNNWGDLFSQHVSKQWNFFLEGITPNPVASIISPQWQPGAECIELLQTQCEMSAEFINAQLPEFVLYWRNRAEPKHSWDSIFIRHLKYVWARQHQLSSNDERQQASNQQRSTRDISLTEQLTDRSWAY